MKYFTNCKNFEEAKSLYHKLSIENHLDRGGDTETQKEINNQYERFLGGFFESAVNDFNEGKEYDIKADTEFFASIIMEIINFNMEVEVIGFWIYARESFNYRNELKEMGFWFSKKHKAWVYSGTKKKFRATKQSADQIRAKYGSANVREHEEQEKITA